MDDRTLELACAALEEFLRAGRFGGKNGEAVTAFLEYRERMGGGDALSPASGRTAQAPDAAASGRGGELERRVEALTAQLAGLERDRQDLAARLKDAQEDIRRAENAERAARSAAAAAEERLAAQQARRLRGQDELLALQHFLESVPAGARELVSAYFSLDDLMTFLVQCGQFSRLNQLWEACGKAVTAGQAPAGLSPLLERLLGLFNLASGQNPATLIAPASGEPYRSEIHFRVNSDGTTVRSLLLPGLRNPGGKMQQPALVELK